MAKVVVRVSRHPAKQPDWARNFLNINGFNMIGALDPVLYSRAAGNVRTKVAQSEPFSPPVTLIYTDENNWEFTWATEAEYTMFLLKWS